MRRVPAGPGQVRQNPDNLAWKMPRAETATHFIDFGVDTDLDDAARQALERIPRDLNRRNAP